MDNLFLVRDILDICKTFNLGVGLVALDQEKAFDRVVTYSTYLKFLVLGKAF